MNKELDPNMSIKEWVENDVHQAAWHVLEFALSSIESGLYHRNGVACLHELSREIAVKHEVPPPEWVKEIRAVLEKHKKNEYQWAQQGLAVVPGMNGPRGPG